MKKNLLILFVIMTGGCMGLQAQEYAKDISIRDQILNNKQPGAVYAPAGPTKQTPAKGFEGSSLKKAIEEGKLGVPVKAADGTATKTPEAKRPAGTVLPSEMTAEQRQAELEKQKAEASKIKPAAIPTQEEPAKEERQQSAADPKSGQ
jgi:hypothetical protein